MLSKLTDYAIERWDTSEDPTVIWSNGWDFPVLELQFVVTPTRWGLGFDFSTDLPDASYRGAINWWNFSVSLGPFSLALQRQWESKNEQ